MKVYKEFAKHILDEINFIEKECEFIDFDSYINNELSAIPAQ